MAYNIKSIGNYLSKSCILKISLILLVLIGITDGQMYITSNSSAIGASTNANTDCTGCSLMSPCYSDALITINNVECIFYLFGGDWSNIFLNISIPEGTQM